MITIRSAIAILGIAALVAGEEIAMTPTRAGMTMSSRAYEYVCWYENLKLPYPGTGGKTAYGTCSHAIDQLIGKEDEAEDVLQQVFRDSILINQVMDEPHLTSKIGAACKKYVKDANLAPAADANNESEMLNEGPSKGVQYPYKGLAYCLLQQLRKTYGQEAIDALKEKDQPPKHWVNILNDRDNEYRARHGVGPMYLDNGLMKAAQEWADKLASECKAYHSKHTDSFRQYKNDHTGENLFSSGAHVDFPPTKAAMALAASNDWYSEVQFYDYATGESTNPKEAVGHFTQTVWKDTNLAGYGYAYNPECVTEMEGQPPQKGQVFVVGRYSPTGNYAGIEQHVNNVLPPKH